MFSVGSGGPLARSLLGVEASLSVFANVESERLWAEQLTLIETEK